MLTAITGIAATAVAQKMSLRFPSPSIREVKHQLETTQSIYGRIVEIVIFKTSRVS